MLTYLSHKDQDLTELLSAVLLSLVAAETTSDPITGTTIHLQPLMDGSNCYSYQTSNGDSLDWVAAKTGVSLGNLVVDNKDKIGEQLSVLPPDVDLKVCDVPSGETDHT